MGQTLIYNVCKVTSYVALDSLQINVTYATCLISLISGCLKFKSPFSSSALIPDFH